MRARSQRQRVRRRAAVLRRVVGEVVGQQLHVQAAGVGRAGGHAGLVTIDQQHVGAVPGQEIGGAQPGQPAADHHHVGAARVSAAAPAAGADAAGGSGAVEQRRLEFRRLEHQRRGGHRAHRCARRGEGELVRHVRAEPRDRRGAEAPLAAPHAGARRLLQRRQRGQPAGQFARAAARR